MALGDVWIIINNRPKGQKGKVGEMYCSWPDGNRVELRRDDRRLHRVFNVRGGVQCATVSGEGDEARVAITCRDGHTELYAGSGRLLRR